MIKNLRTWHILCALIKSDRKLEAFFEGPYKSEGGLESWLPAAEDKPAVPSWGLLQGQDVVLC